MASFGAKAWTNPFGKMSIVRRFQLVVFVALKGVFFVVEYHKTHFPGIYCLIQKDGKMTNFGPKPWTNPFGKMSIFGLFQLVVFIA